jgi:hypothetical protein
MSDERAIDLRGLDAATPEMARGAIERFRRRIIVFIAWLVVFALAGTAIIADTIHKRTHDPAVLVATGASINTHVGNYQVGAIDIGLLKVVEEVDDHLGVSLGFQFVFHSEEPLPGRCCNLYPRQAQSTSDVVAEPGGRFAEQVVILPVSYTSPTGTIDMLLTDGAGHKLGRFTVDLPALGIKGFKGG